jgi:hypothetical protein
MKLALAAAALVVVFVGAASAIAGGEQPAAHGDYAFTGEAAGSTFVVGPFTWDVRTRADGTTKGQFAYKQVRDGVEVTASGRLTCAFFEGSHVWVGGVIEASSRPALVGLDMWFQARDNGKGRKAPPDMSSTLGAAAAPAGQTYCDDHPPVLFPFDVDEGNVRVRS